MFWNKVLALAAYDNSARRMKMRRVSDLSWLVRWLMVVTTTALLVSGLIWPIPTAGAQSGAITGTVKDPNGSAVANARVEVYNEDRSVYEDSHTGDDGSFRIGGLSSGSYTLRAIPPEGSLYTGSAPQSVIVSDSPNNVGVVRLTNAQIIGIVKAPDGTTPIMGAWVQVYSQDWSVQKGSNSDEQGIFRIGGLPNGSYTLRANPPGMGKDRSTPVPCPRR